MFNTNIVEYRTPTSYVPKMKTSVRSGVALSSSLLRLPTEIRNSIYELVMISDNPIERKRGTYALFPDRTTAMVKITRAWCEQRQHVDTATSLSLALTCRQIYRETSGYYYILNKFAFNLLDFPDISHSIRSTNLNRITMVHCTVPTECPPSSMAYLFAMAGLMQLQLKLERNVPRGIDEIPEVIEKLCQLSKSLEEVQMSYSTRSDLVYHWTFLDGQMNRRVDSSPASWAVTRY